MNQFNGLENLTFESTSIYTFVQEIGRGGMGIVYLAQRNSGGVIDYVVLKTIRSLSPDAEEALRKEANLAASLRHENIVKTYGLQSIPLSLLPHPFLKELGALSYINPQTTEKSSQDLLLRRHRFGQHDVGQVTFLKRKDSSDEKRLLLLVMDYIDGTSLQDLMFSHIQAGLLLPTKLTAFIISRIARALAYANKYIIHRDISPENILINTHGVCKLTDFGIAVARNEKSEIWAGKLMYMAPEQLRNEEIDERADIYSLGVVAYQLLTGIPLFFAALELPFQEQIDKVYEQMQEGLVPPSEIRKDIPKVVSDIVMKMLALSPNFRYQRASSVANDLEKKYLYAKGYGPSDNSLGSYISIFESRFERYNEEQLEELSFLKGEGSEIQLKRYLSLDSYTNAGRQLIAERQGTYIHTRLSQIEQAFKEEQLKVKVTKRAFIKIQYLDNVVEAFPLDMGDITVGSKAGNYLILSGAGVADRHARFALQDENACVFDLNSGKGTLVNEKQITQSKLNEGDKVRIGRHIFYFIRQAPWPPSKIVVNLEENSAKDVWKQPDVSFTLFPTADNFNTLARIVEQVLNLTPLAEHKRGVIPMALMEAIRLGGGNSPSHEVEIRITRGDSGIYFTLQGEKSGVSGRGVIVAIHKRMGISEDDFEAAFDPDILASTMMIKSFDRIEYTHNINSLLLITFF